MHMSLLWSGGEGGGASVSIMHFSLLLSGGRGGNVLVPYALVVIMFRRSGEYPLILSTYHYYGQEVGFVSINIIHLSLLWSEGGVSIH